METINKSIKNRKQIARILFLFFAISLSCLELKGYAAEPKLVPYNNDMEVNSSLFSTGGAPLISSSSTQEDILYQAVFKTREKMHWVGDILKYVYNNDPGNLGYVLSDKWKNGAAAVLGNTHPSDRNIYTSPIEYSSSDAPSSLVPITSGLKNIIGISNIDNFVKWYSGYKYNDLKVPREDKLFDIFHSGLVVVGPPNAMKLGTDAAYDEFLDEHNNPENEPVRETLIYAQSNAGLLHAFQDADGVEKWAFLPPNVRQKNRLKSIYLKKNSEQPSEEPMFLADGPVIVEDAFFGTNSYANGDNKYHTVLFGQLGFGGAGMYALDISKATDKADDLKFLWALERNYDGDRKTYIWLGSKEPAETNDYADLYRTASTAFVGFYKDTLDKPCWVFLMGNGAPVSKEQNKKASKIYVGNLFDGSVVKEMTPPKAGDKGSIITPVAVPIANDGVPRHIDRFYVGNASGQIFKGDMSDKDPENWKMESVYSLNAQMGYSYVLEVATIKKEDWLFTGTNDLERYSVPPGGITKNYFYGINASTKRKWEIELKRTNNTVEMLSAAPVIVNGVLYFATTTMGYKSSNKFKYTGIIESKVYIVDPRSGDAAWTEKLSGKYFTVKGGMVSGLSISGKRLAIGVTFSDFESLNKWDQDKTGFTRLGDNLIIVNDLPSISWSDSSGDNDNMTPLYWKTR